MGIKWEEKFLGKPYLLSSNLYFASDMQDATIVLFCSQKTEAWCVTIHTTALEVHHNTNSNSHWMPTGPLKLG